MAPVLSLAAKRPNIDQSAHPQTLEVPSGLVALAALAAALVALEAPAGAC